MAILDTSLLVALFDLDHPHHKPAREAVLGHGVWHVSGGVLAEFTQAIRRLTNEQGSDGNAAARQALESLRAFSGYRTIQEYDEPHVARIHATAPGMSYVDAWGVSLAVTRQEPLLTLDGRQRRLLAQLG